MGNCVFLRIIGTVNAQQLPSGMANHLSQFQSYQSFGAQLAIDRAKKSPDKFPDSRLHSVLTLEESALPFSFSAPMVPEVVHAVYDLVDHLWTRIGQFQIRVKPALPGCDQSV